MILAPGGIETAEAWSLLDWRFSHTDRVTLAVGVLALAVMPDERDRELNVGIFAIGQASNVAAPTITATSSGRRDLVGLHGGNV